MLWFGQIVSQLGDWFSFVTLQALLLRLTGEAGAVAGLFVAQLLPVFVLGPLAGVVVDRLSRRTVMILADVVRGVVALGFLAIHDRASSWLAYPLFIGLSTCSVFFEPARTATLPNVTSREELVTANALSSVTWSILLTTGALAGGITAATLGDRAAFLFNSLSFFTSALLIGRMVIPVGPQSTPAGGGFADVVAGLRYVRQNPMVAGVLSAKMGWGLTGGSQLLIAIYGQRLFPLPGDTNGVLTLSLLLAVGGIGTAIGPIVGRRLVGSEPALMRRAIAAAFLLAGVFLYAMGSAESLLTTALTLCIARIGGSVVWVFSTILLQMETHDEYRGRVFAAENSLFTLTMMASNVVVGQAVDANWLSPFGAGHALGVTSVVLSVAWTSVLARRALARRGGVDALP